MSAEKLSNGDRLLQYTDATLSLTEMNVLQLNSFQLISFEKQFFALQKQETEIKILIDKVVECCVYLFNRL